MTPPAAVQLRPLRPSDLRSLLVLERAAFPPPDAYPATLFVSLWLTPWRLFLVAQPATPDGALRGYSVSVPQGWRGAYIVSFAVHPRAQRQGVGCALLAATVDHWRARGRAHLDLHVRADNHAARALYSGHGFRARAHLPGFYGRGADGLAMRMALR